MTVAAVQALKYLAKLATNPGCHCRQIRFISSSNDTVNVRKIDDRVHLTTLKNDEADDKSKPLAIIYKWLRARPQDVRKYEEIYLGRGFDVVTTGISIPELFHRPSVLKRNESIIKMLTQPEMVDRPFLIHSFSVGGYVKSELRLRVLEDPYLSENFTRRLMAVVYDSFIDYTGAYYGLSRTIAGNSKLADVIEMMLNTVDEIMSKNPKSMAAAFRATMNLLHENPYPVPSMFFYSSADLLGAPKWSEATVQACVKSGLTVHTKCWSDSPHCGHLRYHKEEYIHALNQFLSVIPELNKSPSKAETDGGELILESVEDSAAATPLRKIAAVNRKH